MTALGAALASGEVSAVELSKHFLKRIESLDGHDGLNAFLTVDAKGALAAAEASDARRRSNGSLRPLDGIPVAVKDNIHVRGLPTTCASTILLRRREAGAPLDAAQGFLAPGDATVTERLRDAGAVILGKTNLDEFAMGSSTENSAFGPTRNPWDPSRVPGGSSGGSAAAVAAGLVPLALGSETGGSIRQPAALCGIAGLKTTYGRVSRNGLVAFGSSLDQIGPMARTVGDLALALAVIGGRDPKDATSVDAALPDTSVTGSGVQGLRVGVLRDQIEAEGVEPSVREACLRAVEALRAAGATLVDASLPHAADGIAVYYLIATSEASSNLARFDGVRYGLRASGTDLASLYDATRDAGFGAEVKRRILLGTFALSAGYSDAYYQRALRVRRLIADDYERAFRNCDVLVGPTSATAAFRIGAKSDDPLAMYLCDVFCVAANLAGVPAASVPCGFDAAGLPLGFQVQAPALREDLVLRAAGAVERALGSTDRFPGGCP
jgi:aspartyl-tRNA(Asn)/glutamyl-tRNA(Gln) amidotransferase subunit A